MHTNFRRINIFDPGWVYELLTPSMLNGQGLASELDREGYVPNYMLFVNEDGPYMTPANKQIETKQILKVHGRVLSIKDGDLVKKIRKEAESRGLKPKSISAIVGAYAINCEVYVSKTRIGRGFPVEDGRWDPESHNEETQITETS